MSEILYKVNSSYIGFKFVRKGSVFKVIDMVKNQNGTDIRVVCRDRKGNMLNICKRQFLRYKKQYNLSQKQLEQLNVIF